jgi:hypothetical protein
MPLAVQNRTVPMVHTIAGAINAAIVRCATLIGAPQEIDEID